MFAIIFRDKRELLGLYNAVNGTDYTDPEQLEVNTLENAIYMSMYNDLSFIIDTRLNLYEHQSTYSPNLPLRCLFYISDLYSDITKDANLYGRKPVRIPTPRFVIFYNGEEKRPERETLLLSELFTVPDEVKSLELKAVVLNVNTGYNEELLSTCRTLGDYAEYTQRVRTYAKTMELEIAVERAITECIREGILADFLKKNRAEAKKVSIYEYDEQKHMRFVREEGWEDGWESGRREGRREGREIGRQEGRCEGQREGKGQMVMDVLKELGEIPDELREKILMEEKEEELTRYVKIASKAKTMEQAVKEIIESGCN